MFRLGADLKVYLHREPIDFRAGINSLAVLVQETMALDPFAPAVFAFCNRRRDRMKVSAIFSARRRRLSMFDFGKRRAESGGSGSFGEVEGQQVGDIGVVSALRQFGEDVAQPG